ncbi:hypothetical protein N7475_008797 [Penicillium sp. IBT 31633x]|nr:hypothetical protein N7475_008797 [Penicillium sp. IBT 31633x]
MNAKVSINNFHNGVKVCFKCSRKPLSHVLYERSWGKTKPPPDTNVLLVRAELQIYDICM